MIDITGQSFGRWTVLRCVSTPRVNVQSRWLCVCECGKEGIVPFGNLRNGRSQSCGCKRVEIATKRLTKHGGSYSLEYYVWRSMRDRCNNPRNPYFHCYGGRGISVCERWQNDFEAFLEDMGPRPSPDLSIERIDNDQGYSPDNCKWATTIEQAHNQRHRKSLKA